MHRVVVLAVPPVTTFDLAIPEMVFPAARVDGEPVYEVVVCTPDPGAVAAYTGRAVVVDHGLEQIATADTVIVTGTGARIEGDPRVLDTLRAAAAAGTRIASICTGAFVLAQAGLLTGRPATTYWLYSAEMRERFPDVDLQPDVLFVDDGQILTSAGLAAGLDLCVYIVRRDHGATVANAVARLAVVAPLRPGARRSSSRRHCRRKPEPHWPKPAPGRCNDSTNHSLSTSWPPTPTSVPAPSPAGSAPKRDPAPCNGSCTSASTAHANCWKPPTCPCRRSPASPDWAQRNHYACT